MRPLLPVVAALCLVSWACHSRVPLTPAELAEREHQEAWLEHVDTSHTSALPAGWLSGTARDFSDALQRWDLPKVILWDKVSHTQLTQVLLKLGQTPREAEAAVRAALLLSRDHSPPSQASLLTRLERRMLPAERGRQAVDVVCAAALSKFHGLDAGAMGSLQRLVSGRIPHPDLDVRVECARAYLAHIPCDPETTPPLRARNCLRFLIKVLRSETSAQASDPITWPRIRTVAWPKGRAAQEIVRWHPSEIQFQPDGPWKDQIAWTALAERALGL
ncbi:MAG: hypothetical protein GY930_16965 [bacterium]|nr:hypothetical protein [bacterium]